MPIIDLREVFFICDADEKVVALALTFPGISDAVRKSKGHMGLISLLRLLYTIHNPRVIDLGLIAVNHEYKNSGLTAVFVDSITKSYKQFKHLDHFETNLNLEDNLAIRNMWSRFDSVENKRKRSFVKQL